MNLRDAVTHLIEHLIKAEKRTTKMYVYTKTLNTTCLQMSSQVRIHFLHRSPFLDVSIHC